MDIFFALDVETANADMESICQVGIAEFQDNKIVNQWGSLVDPEDYFDPFNISIHGITPEMVNGAPTFPVIHKMLQEICKLVEKVIVVTHTPFDQISMRRASQKYGLDEISWNWLDSTRIVRRQWEKFRHSGYGLSNVAKELGIEYKSHDAIEDARAAGEVLIKAIEQSGLSLEVWLDKAYKPISKPVSSGKVSHAQEGDPSGPFYGETITFTGALSLPRKEAARLAALVGCNVSDGVTKATTLLVVGIQNKDRLAGYEKSSKHRKAENLTESGQSIRIITENDFLEMIEQGKSLGFIS
jgi:DNA polymerase III subunit epsilon